jgi:hypothetical protein
MSLTLWIFLGIIVFCIYILFGLYLTEDSKTTTQLVLTWVVYTILWITFINIILLAFFWESVRNKTGPVGVRGPSGETGNTGIEGSCSINASQVYLIKILSEMIDGLYKEKTGKNILDTTTMKFPNNYLNNKIASQSSSRQYNVIIANLSNQNKPISDIVNYLKDIWKVWFELLYNSSSEWFEDVYGDEEYSWTNYASTGETPFTEIRKYDVYYWGITRSFRPLKAEICRTNNGYSSSKIPQKVTGPRLKMLETNDYYFIGDDYKTDGRPDASWWRAKTKVIGDDTYYPVGDIITSGNRGTVYWGRFNKPKTIVGDIQMDNPTHGRRGNGPRMKTILVAGDVKNPVAGNTSAVAFSGGRQDITTDDVKCPDGYTGLGTILSSGWFAGERSAVKCIPKDCVEEVKPTNKITWADDWGHWMTVIADWAQNQDPTADNNYNLFRNSKTKTPYYRIKESCLVDSYNQENVTKELEPEFDKLGFGWYGHPYKLESKYSIFSFLGMVPEGMIVHQATGRRFYIIHYGGEEVNLYLVLEYSQKNDDFSKALQVSDNDANAEITIRDTSRKDPRQQWIIELQNDKAFLKLRNVQNKRYLYIGLEPRRGDSQYSTIDLDFTNHRKGTIYNDVSDEYIGKATTFTFISTYGTQLNIIDRNIPKVDFLIGNRVRFSSQPNQLISLFGVLIYGKDGTIINIDTSKAKQSSIYRGTHTSICAVRIVAENTSRNINQAMQNKLLNNKALGWNTMSRNGKNCSMTNGDKTAKTGGDWWEYVFDSPIEIMGMEVYLHYIAPDTTSPTTTSPATTSPTTTSLSSTMFSPNVVKQRNQNVVIELFNDTKYPDSAIWVGNTGMDIPSDARQFFLVNKNGTIKHSD